MVLYDLPGLSLPGFPAALSLLQAWASKVHRVCKLLLLLPKPPSSPSSSLLMSHVLLLFFLTGPSSIHAFRQRGWVFNFLPFYLLSVSRKCLFIYKHLLIAYCMPGVRSRAKAKTQPSSSRSTETGFPSVLLVVHELQRVRKLRNHRCMQ